MERKKHLCDCGNVAVWDLMSSSSKDNFNPYFCEDCVPRGCSCNQRYVDINAYHPPLDNPDMPEGTEGVDWKWVEQDKIWCYINEQGREYPCCEFDYEEGGHEEPTDEEKEQYRKEMEELERERLERNKNN